MSNYRNNKERYIPNKLGSLYVNSAKLNENERPVIYIGGQMEHRFHVLEQTGYSADLGHNMFTGNWFYDYPVMFYDKSLVNATNMADNLLESLRMAHLHEVDLVTESFGGMIGAYASKSDLIHNVYAIHPPIFGSPLADSSILETYKSEFNDYEKKLLKLVKFLVNPNYGFEQENAKGLDLSRSNLDKILVIGSCIDPTMEKNKMVLGCYCLILKATKRKSDGVVLLEDNLFDKYGINHINDLKSTNHIDAGSQEYLNYVKENVIKR